MNDTFSWGSERCPTTRMDIYYLTRDTCLVVKSTELLMRVQCNVYLFRMSTDSNGPPLVFSERNCLHKPTEFTVTLRPFLVYVAMYVHVERSVVGWRYTQLLLVTAGFITLTLYVVIIIYVYISRNLDGDGEFETIGVTDNFSSTFWVVFLFLILINKYGIIGKELNFCRFLIKVYT